MENIKIKKSWNRGGATGLRPWVISLVVVIFVAALMVSFIVSFLTETNPNSEVLNNKYGLNQSVVNMRTSLNSFSNTVNSAKITLANSSASATDYLFLIFRGAFDIPLSFLSFSVQGIAFVGSLVNNVAFGDAGTTQGFGEVVNLANMASGLIMAGLLATIIFLIIKGIRTGESER